MRRRPSVPPEGEAAAIDIRIGMEWIEIMRAGGVDAGTRKYECPEDEKPPGMSRFSTLFYVAAIGGKSPRVFSCEFYSKVQRLPCQAGAEKRRAPQSFGISSSMSFSSCNRFVASSA
jgi:hypothetical protein